MKNKSALLLVTLILIFSVLAATATLSAKEIEIKFAHEEPGDAATSSIHAAALVFKNIVETQSNGEMVVNIYPASSMGQQRERMELTQANVLQINIASIGGIAQFYPEISAIDLPFAFSNVAVADTVFDGVFGDKLKKNILEETGLRFLGVSGGSFYVLSNNVRPIKTPEDMKGIKFRTMSVPSHIAMIRALGGAATPVDWAELYTSLQTGVVDGQHNPISIMAIGGLQEVQKYVTLTNHLYGVDWWFTSQDFYEELTEEQRRIFINGYTNAIKVGRGTKMMLEATKFGVNFLEASGIKVYSPSSEELNQFKELTIPPVLDTLEEELGQEGVDLANELLDAVKKAEDLLYN
ncbi:MAG: DctP family TRAP transporter solute-binding subunit [Actinomycetota bacterium]|nr:DctP family TRAP transporter solute-binding subunit [Actinomycetota bacterium]